MQPAAALTACGRCEHLLGGDCWWAGTRQPEPGDRAMSDDPEITALLHRLVEEEPPFAADLGPAPAERGGLTIKAVLNAFPGRRSGGPARPGEPGR
jgi:hypothetical protein